MHISHRDSYNGVYFDAFGVYFMAIYEIVGKRPLSGEVKIQGSKNAVLPILAGSILNKGTVQINQCPKIEDVFYMLHILKDMGCNAWWEKDTLFLNTQFLTSNVVSGKYARGMRSSIIFLGALLAREKCAVIAYPGGCLIGERPIDLHLKALKKMGAKINETEELLFCNAKELIGEKILLDFPSVGATENIILAAVLSKENTIIQNAAKEPEIIILCEFLRSMGAKIQGDGTEIIVIKGVSRLHDTNFTIPSDRIVMGTYMAAVCGAGGDVILKGNCGNELGAVSKVFIKMGCKIESKQEEVHITFNGKRKAISEVKTEPYPGFPTDMQSQLLTLLAASNGISSITETIFEARFNIVEELKKMGAKIETKENTAIVYGVNQLNGNSLHALDLRGGAALVIGGLMAEGVTTVSNIEYIERGYENIVRDLTSLGASITKKEAAIHIACSI